MPIDHIQLTNNSIFISYRKDDSGGWAAKFADDLRAIVGTDAVFIDDSSGISLGTHWRDQIDLALNQCRVFLPVIAPSWTIEPNLGRLKSPDDWVRKELLTAHRRKPAVLSIPIFVNEALALNPDQFSDDAELRVAIASLMNDQGMKLDRSPEHWPSKVTQLVSSIKHQLGLNIPGQIDATVNARSSSPNLIQGKPNNLPFPSLGSLFKGREPFLQDLYQQLNLANQGTTAITDKAHPKRARAVHGSGGIGKTRTAIEYAWRNESHYNSLLFLSAQTPEMLQSSLAELTKVLPITGLTLAPDDQLVEAALNWLETNPGWMLILDNVDTDEAAAAVKTRLPQLTQGHVLITSRLSQWSAGVKTLDLGVLDLSDATAYLLDATDAKRVHTDQDADIAELIAIKTGQLALGLEHAAAFINARHLGFIDYLAQWERNKAKILETFDLGLIEYPHELLVTWKLSVDQLDDGARELLDVLSWLSPEPVPDSFFQAAPDEGYLAAREAIATLCKYSLANRVQEGEQRGFQIHRLVQATTRYHQQKTGARDLPALDKALAWTNKAYQLGDPADIQDWPKLEPLTEHVEVLCQFANQHGKTGEETLTALLLNDLGQFYFRKARHTAAELLMRRALQIDEHSYGENHPRVARDLNNLASLLRVTSRLSEAEPLMRRALQIVKHSYGEDHPTVAINLNNLAQLLKATNRLPEAEPLIRRALSIDEHCYGKDHPEVARDLNNLAQLLQATNRMSEAEPLMRRGLQIEQNSYGEDHPRVAIQLNNLAGLLQATNRLSEAEPLMRRALTIDEHSYGEDHPNVTTDLNNLAQLLQATNRLSEAEPLMRRMVEILHQISQTTGHRHPHMKVVISNYENLLTESGLSKKEAVEQVQEVLSLATS